MASAPSGPWAVGVDGGGNGPPLNGKVMMGRWVVITPLGGWVLGLPLSHLPAGLARPLVWPGKRPAKRLFIRPEWHHIGNFLELGEDIGR